MSWVKMDDQWPFNRKLRLVEPTDRLMWVMAIPYCSGQTTDGRLDGPMLEMVAFLAGASKPYEAADRLVAAGLFDLDAGGWRVHDYLEFQPSAEQRAHISEERKRAGQVGGKKSGEARRKPPANGKQVASGSVQHFGTPSSPVPSRPVLGSSSLQRESVVSQGSAEGTTTTTSPDARLDKTRTAVAVGLTRLYGIPAEKAAGYRAAIVRDFSDHAEAVSALLAAHPAEDAEEIANRYLATRRKQPAASKQPKCGVCGADAHPNGPIDCPRMAS